MIRYLFALMLLAATATHAGYLVIAEPLPEERDEVSAWLDNAARDVLGWNALAPNNFAIVYSDGSYRRCTRCDERLTAEVVSRMSARCPTLGITYQDSIPTSWKPVEPDEVR